MGRAYKCDRCGKLYDKLVAEYTLEYKTLFNKGVYTIRLEKIPDALSCSIDLCWDCYKKLCDFLEGYRNDAKGGEAR